MLENGEKVTLGIMLPGSYEFGTDGPEIMEILSGDLRVLSPGEQEWLEIQGSATFNVPGNSSFKLEIRTVTDYCLIRPCNSFSAPHDFVSVNKHQRLRAVGSEPLLSMPDINACR